MSKASEHGRQQGAQRWVTCMQQVCQKMRQPHGLVVRHLIYTVITSAAVNSETGAGNKAITSDGRYVLDSPYPSKPLKNEAKSAREGTGEGTYTRRNDQNYPGSRALKLSNTHTKADLTCQKSYLYRCQATDTTNSGEPLCQLHCHACRAATQAGLNHGYSHRAWACECD